MTSPVIVIEQDQLLKDAVDLMLNKRVERLPVVDAEGKLAGMLSRLDIFRTIMQQAPDWNMFQTTEHQRGGCDNRFRHHAQGHARGAA